MPVMTLPDCTLPDCSQRSFDQPLTVSELAACIGAGLAKAADGLEIIRHSAAHLLAQVPWRRQRPCLAA